MNTTEPAAEAGASPAGADPRPRVSIGLPVYNGENFLAAAIDSVLNQTFADLELIICDDASTDRTAQICQDYAAKDERVRYLRNEKNR
ncbi:MAG: glycosyltransferase family 2 protein, partial [Allosphingosinicella sp.]